MLFEVVPDKLSYHLGRRQILRGAEFLKRFLFYRVYQDCEAGTFRFHGSGSREDWNMLIKL